jgi:hypothetical protein
MNSRGQSPSSRKREERQRTGTAVPSPGIKRVLNSRECGLL